MSAPKHIEWDAIVDYVESGSMLPPRVREHLASCEQCGAKKREAENLLGALDIVAAPEPSAAQVQAAWLRVREEQRAAKGAGRVERVAQALREIWATLSPDLLVPSHALRGDAGAPALQFFEAGDFVITVSLQEKDHATQVVLGKIIPQSGTEPPTGVVSLAIDGEDRETDIGPHGAFRFDGVKRGAVRLDVRIGDAVIHLPPLAPGGPTA